MPTESSDPVEVLRITGETHHLLGKVAADVFDDDIDPDRIRQFLTLPGHLLFIAHDGNRTVGQCLGIVHWAVDRPPQLLIENLGVTPEFRRKGIGRALMLAVMEAAAAMGCASMWLGADPESDTAQPFYRAMGMPLKSAAFTEVDLPFRAP